MKKDYSQQILFILFLIFSFSLIAFSIFYHNDSNPENYVIDELSTMNLDNINNLMIVAHPDDEILWGGYELINDNYLVICVTCGQNMIRVHEFQKSMKITNDKYIMLGYSDKVFNVRSDWNYSYKYIKNDIKYIVEYKDWQKIVTHNVRGEYGHIHHKMVHKMVVETAPKDKIYTFGRYCSAINIKNKKCRLPKVQDDKMVSNEMNILRTVYKSQKQAVDKYSHMLPYNSLTKLQKPIRKIPPKYDTINKVES